MGQNNLHCIVWKNTKESEHLTQIPKPHLSTSLGIHKTSENKIFFKTKFPCRIFGLMYVKSGNP